MKKSTALTARLTLTALSFAALAPAVALAQTSGTFTPTIPIVALTAIPYNYSTAPWVITSGPGTYPDGGGTATILTGIGSTPGTLFSGTGIALDVSPTLSQLVFNSPYTTFITPGAGTSLVAASTGLTLNAIQTPANTPTLFQLANAISAPISGGGSVGLTKIGSGTVTLGTTNTTAASGPVSVANTYTGGTHINGGILAVSASAAVGDGVFGAAGAGNGISFNGGGLFFNVTNGLTSARDIFIDVGGATIYTNTATTLSGIISGSGSLNNAGFAAVALTLTGANTYTGATIGAQNVSAFVLSGNGSIATSSSYDLTGSMTLTNTGTNVTNRLSDTAAMTLRGVNFVSTGNATATSSETIGAVTAASSYSTFLVTPGATAANSLTMASLTRQNNATVAFRGTGLGGTPGNTVSNIYSTLAPTLVGGGGAAGSTNISILPWAYGNSSNTTGFTAANLVGSSFVTYGANGFRPLATTEYAAAFGGSPTDNVRLTAATAAGAGVTANSVLFAPAAAATLSGGTINITSGAFLYSPTVSSTGTVSAALNFSAAEGIITNTSILNLSGAISGSGGVTYTTAFANATPSTASIALSGGTSTYTGNTTINSGTVGLSGTVAAAGSPSIFGNSGTIVLAGGINFAALSATASATLNRDISSIGTGTNYVAGAGAGTTFTLNGNISLTNSLFIYGNSNTVGAAFTFNGTISGTGGIIDTTVGYSIFNGNNTYSGGTTLPSSSTFVVGSDTAFGTGPLYVTGTGTLQGSGTTARTLANTLFLAASPTIAGTAPLTFTGAVDINGGSRTLTISNTALTTFSGVVSNGAITKGGNGAVVFNSATGNTFTGGFLNTGAAGTSSAIYVNNTSGSGLGTGAVSVGGASASVFSTLAGSFTISGATSIGGRLSPGNGTGLTAATAGTGSIGTENFGSSLTLSSATTSSLALEVASASSFDRIVVAGAFTLNGTVFLSTTGGYVAQIGDTYDLVDWGTITVGTFTFNTTGASVAPGGSFDTSQFAVNGTVTVVPEPTTWAMIAGGLGLLVACQRRKGRRSA